MTSPSRTFKSHLVHRDYIFRTSGPPVDHLERPVLQPINHSATGNIIPVRISGHEITVIHTLEFFLKKIPSLSLVSKFLISLPSPN